MMNSKKGADLSMNVIIIAAIALLVLVILAVLLFRAGGDVDDATQCQGVGGVCRAVGDGPDGYIRNPVARGCSEGSVCFVPLGEITEVGDN